MSHCPRCNGVGAISAGWGPYSPAVYCPECKGRSYKNMKEKCPGCKGQGRILEDTPVGSTSEVCCLCYGSGTIEPAKPLVGGGDYKWTHGISPKTKEVLEAMREQRDEILAREIHDLAKEARSHITRLASAAAIAHKGLTINDMAKQANKTATEHGFWAAWAGNVAHNEYEYANILLAKLSLVHSEVAEAVEEVRKKDFDLKRVGYREDGKPEGFGPELADIVIRVGDLAWALGLDLEKLVLEKMAYNKGREKMHGKNA